MTMSLASGTRLMLCIKLHFTNPWPSVRRVFSTAALPMRQ